MTIIILSIILIFPHFQQSMPAYSYYQQRILFNYQFRLMKNSHLYKTTASTLQKVANLPRYRHPADLINVYTRPIRQQRLQIDGQLQFGQNLYFSQAQQKLVQQLMKSRRSYVTGSIENKNKIANTQFDLWKDYLSDQVAKTPNSQLIQGDKRQKIYESYLTAKERNQQKMQLAKTVKLFSQISKGFKFDLRMHPLVIMRMVYPHFGYLNNYTEQRLTFDQYTKFLQEIIAVSKLFYDGSTLHGNQLLSFVFWKAYTANSSMNLEQFCKFLTLFKFNVKPENINKQFEYHLKDKDGQLKAGSPVRFDFWRTLYLQRGL